MTRTREKEILNLILDKSIEFTEKQLKEGPEYDQYLTFIKVMGLGNFSFEAYTVLNRESSIISLKDYMMYKKPHIMLEDINYSRLSEFRLVLSDSSYKLPGVSIQERQHFLSLVGGILSSPQDKRGIGDFEIPLN